MILTIDDSHKIRIKGIKGCNLRKDGLQPIIFLSEIHSEMDAWIFS